MFRHVLAALLCAAAPVSAMQTSSRQIVNVGPAPVGPYSPAVKAGGLIYLSGTLAQDDAGAIVGADVGAQTARVIERMRKVLNASGSSLEQVVAVTVYLKSASDFPAMNDAYRLLAEGSADADDRDHRTCCSVALVEISMIAVPIGRRADGHPPGRLDAIAQPLQLRDQIRRHAVPLRPRAAQRPRQHAGGGGHHGADEGGHGQRRRAAERRRHGPSPTSSARASTCPTRAAFQQMNAAYRPLLQDARPRRARRSRPDLAGKGYAVEITFVASSAPRQAIGVASGTANLSPAIRAGHRLYLSGVLGQHR